MYFFLPLLLISAVITVGLLLIWLPRRSASIPVPIRWALTLVVVVGAIFGVEAVLPLLGYPE